jgi:hypothetical protein
MKKKKNLIDLSHLGKDAMHDIVGAILSAKCSLARKGYTVHVKMGRKVVNKGRKRNCGLEG